MSDSADEKIISFVSDKNTKVESVLFVIKTPKIEIEKQEVVVTEKKEKSNGFQKFLKLFGH